ncbi:MAG: succinyl-diaminopimelate desuccinylase [Formosimonas sp.]
MTTPTFDLTCDLLRLASVTPNDETCQDLLIKRLEPLGFDCETLVSGPDDFRVTNLWAMRRGSGAGVERAKTFVFAGHTDVVPTGPVEQWSSEPFTPTIKDGYLYGRGAADMKTSIAAFVTSIEAFLESTPNPTHSIALLITSDEEGPAHDGTIKVVELLKARGEILDYCIVGEPTSNEVFGDMMKNGRRGTMSGKLTVKGIQGHIAYPHRARNPIHQFAPALTELAATVWDEGNDYFQPTSWQVSNIHGGTGASNIIPGAVVVDFNFRFSTASTSDGLQTRVVDILNRHGLEYDLTWVIGGQPFLTEAGSLSDAISTAVVAEVGVTPELSTTGGTSDGRFIATICPQVVEFGPVSKSIHQIDERVEVASMAPLAGIYARVLAILVA